MCEVKYPDNYNSDHIRTVCQVYFNARLKYSLFKYIDKRWFNLVTEEDGYKAGEVVDIELSDLPTFSLGQAIREALFRNIVLELNTIFYDTDKKSISIAKDIIVYKFTVVQPKGVEKTSNIPPKGDDGIYKLVNYGEEKYYQKYFGQVEELTVSGTRKCELDKLKDGEVLNYSKAKGIFKNLSMVSLDKNFSRDLLEKYEQLNSILRPYRDKNLAHKDKSKNYSGFSQQDLDKMIGVADELIKWFIGSNAKDDDVYICERMITHALGYDNNGAVWFFMNRLAGLSIAEIGDKMLNRYSSE